MDPTCIYVISITIIGGTGVYGYSYARLDIVTNSLITQYSDRPVQIQWNNNLGHATYRPTDALGRATGAGVHFNACTPVRTQQDEPVTAVGLPHNEGRDFDTTVTVIGDESSDDLSVTSMEDYGFDATFYTDFSRAGIENFINYFMWNDPDAIGDLALYPIDQLADAMRGHEHDVFASLEYLSEDEDGIRDYRERILNRVRQ